MRTLVTGASGFIGRTLCAQLIERGHEVVALVRRPGSEPAGTRAVGGELSDAQRLTDVLAGERPDCVVHLAAEIASQRSERKIHEVNVRGVERLLDACLLVAGAVPANGPRFVFASTVVTGDARGALLTEETALPVQTPYGRSKQEGERLVLQSGLPAAVIRPSHVYGPGGWYAEELVARLRQPGRFAVIGRGENLWDVVHVDDVAGALVLAAEQAPQRVDLSRRRRRADHVLRLHGAHGPSTRGRRAPADSGCARAHRGRAQRRRGRRPLCPLLQREDQAGDGVAASVSDRARGRRRRGCAAGHGVASRRTSLAVSARPSSRRDHDLRLNACCA